MLGHDLSPKKLGLIALGFVIPMIAARTTRRVAGKGYELLTNSEVPRNPAGKDTGWKEALIWAMLSGAIAGVSRMSARRFLSETGIPSEGDDMDEEVEDIEALTDLG